MIDTTKYIVCVGAPILAFVIVALWEWAAN